MIYVVILLLQNASGKIANHLRMTYGENPVKVILKFSPISLFGDPFTHFSMTRFNENISGASIHL